MGLFLPQPCKCQTGGGGFCLHPDPTKGPEAKGAKLPSLMGCQEKQQNLGVQGEKKSLSFAVGQGRSCTAPCVLLEGGTREAPTPSMHRGEFGSARQRSGCIPAVSTADLLCFKKNEKNVSNEINS